MRTKKLWNQIVSILLVIALLPVSALAELRPEDTAHPDVVNEFTASVSHVNPEYERLGVRFPRPTADCMTMAETTVDTLEEAAEYLAMKLSEEAAEYIESREVEELADIVKRSAGILGVELDDEGADVIAGRCRGTPRIANALLRRVRDFAQVMGSGNIDLAIARYALDALNIDKRGLDAIDNKILKTIITKFKGGPVGANTIATAVGEDQGTLEEVYEPFLIKEGFIIRTPRGREATELAYRHLGLEKGNINFDDPTLF